MPIDAARRERAVLLLAIGLLLLGLGFGSLFSGSGFSSEPLSSGGPDFVTPVVLFAAGAVLISAGLLVRRTSVA